MQIRGLVSVQQQLQKLSVHRSLRSLRDILIDAVEEKRVAGRSPPGSPGKSPEPWRLTAMAKLTDNRYRNIEGRREGESGRGKERGLEGGRESRRERGNEKNGWIAGRKDGGR